MRAIILAVCVVLIATSCGGLSRLLPCSERRHASGIAIVCREDITPWANATEDLKGTHSFAMELALAYPDSFGYPVPDFEQRQVVLRIVRPDAEIVARRWLASGIDLQEAFGKVRSLPRPMVPLRFETATRSVKQLEGIKDDIGPNLRDLPDADAICQSGPDVRRNATRFTIDRESDALLRALAQRYGTEALVVEIDPARPDFR